MKFQFQCKYSSTTSVYQNESRRAKQKSHSVLLGVHNPEVSISNLVLTCTLWYHVHQVGGSSQITTNQVGPDDHNASDWFGISSKLHVGLPQFSFTTRNRRSKTDKSRKLMGRIPMQIQTSRLWTFGFVNSRTQGISSSYFLQSFEKARILDNCQLV